MMSLQDTLRKYSSECSTILDRNTDIENSKILLKELQKNDTLINRCYEGCEELELGKDIKNKIRLNCQVIYLLFITENINELLTDIDYRNVQKYIIINNNESDTDDIIKKYISLNNLWSVVETDNNGLTVLGKKLFTFGSGFKGPWG